MIAVPDREIIDATVQLDMVVSELFEFINPHDIKGLRDTRREELEGSVSYGDPWGVEVRSYKLHRLIRHARELEAEATYGTIPGMSSDLEFALKRCAGMVMDVTWEILNIHRGIHESDATPSNLGRTVGFNVERVLNAFQDYLSGLSSIIQANREPQFRGDIKIGTLGPVYSDSHKAASYYKCVTNPVEGSVSLYGTFDEAMAALGNGEITHVLVPAAFSGANNYFFGKEYSGIELVDSFSLPLQKLVLLGLISKMPYVESKIGSVASHPVLEGLVKERYKDTTFIPSSSKSQAVIDCIGGVADGVLTSETTYDYGIFYLLDQIPTIPMQWLVFANKQTDYCTDGLHL